MLRDISTPFQRQSYLSVFLNSDKFKITQPLSPFGDLPKYCFGKVCVMSIQPITTYSEHKFHFFYSSVGGVYMLNNREGVDEPRSFKLFEYNTFFNSACYPAV